MSFKFIDPTIKEEKEGKFKFQGGIPDIKGEPAQPYQKADEVLEEERSPAFDYLLPGETQEEGIKRLYEERRRREGRSPFGGYDIVTEEEVTVSSDAIRHRAELFHNVSQDITPQQAAKITDLSDKTGWSPPLVLEQEKDAEFRSVTPVWDTLERSLLRFMSTSPTNAAVSRGDTSKLNNVAKIQKESTSYLSRLGTAAQTAYKSGDFQTQLAPLYFDKYINDSQAHNSKISELEKGLVKTEVEDFPGKVITASAETLPNVIAATKGGLVRGLQGAVMGALGASAVGLAFPPLAVAAGAAALATGTGMYAYGLAETAFYLEAGFAAKEFADITNEKGESLDSSTVKGAAILAGIVNAGLEAVGNIALLRTIPGVNRLITLGPRKVVKEALKKTSYHAALARIGTLYAQGITVETLTEGLQEAVTILFGEAAKEKEKIEGKEFESATVRDTAKRILEAGAMGFYASVGLGAPGTTISVAKEVTTVAKANKFYKDQAAVNDAINATELKERSPAKMKEFLDLTNKNQEVLLEGDVAQKYYQIDENKILEKVGLTKEEIFIKSRQGQDITLSLSDIHSKLKPEEAKALLAMVKQTPNDISFADAENVNVEEELKRVVEIYEEATRDEQLFKMEIKRLNQEIQMAGASKEYADTITQTWGAFARRMSLEGQELTQTLEKIQVGLATPQEMEAAIITGIELNGPEIPAKPIVPKGALTITDEKYLVKLFNEADVSTLLHETGHIFLSEVKGLIDSGKASENFTQDWGKIKTWLNIKEGEGVSRKQHEKFARGFEQYLMEGKAPTAELTTAFERFKKWLTTLYSSIQEISRQAGFQVNLTDEARGVFDRLLATNTQIDNFIQENNFIVSSEEMANLNLSDKDAWLLRQLLQKGKDKAKEALQKRLIKERNRNLIRWRKEAKLQVETEQVYRLHNNLVGKTKPGMDALAIKEEVGEGAYKKLKTKNRQYTRQNGLSPHVLAIQFGYDTISEMVQDLTNAPSKKERINFLVREKENALYLDFTGENAVLAWSSGMDEYIAALGNFIGKKAGIEQTIPQKIYRNFVEEQFTDKPLKEALRIDYFLSAMRRALKNKDKAIKKGDFGEALKFIREARLNYEYSRKVKSLQRETDKLLRFITRALKAKDKISTRFYDNFVATAKRFNLARQAVNPEKEPLLSVIKDKDSPVLDMTETFSAWVLNEGITERFRDLSVEKFTEVNNLLRFLAGRGREETKALNAYAEREHDEVVREMVESAGRLKDKPIWKEYSILRKIPDATRAFIARTDIPLFVFQKLDFFTALQKGSYQKGVHQRVIYDSLSEAASSKEVLLKKVKEELKAPLDQLAVSAAKFPKVMTENMPAVPANMAADGRAWNFNKIIAVALNMGNEHNRKAIMEGYGLSEQEINQLLAVLSDTDWKAIRNIAGIVETLWPALNSTYEKINYFPSKKVEGDPFITPTGLRLEGWYYPLRFDKELSLKAAQREEVEVLKESHAAAFSHASVRSGAMTTRKRTSGGLPPRLDLGVLAQHFDFATQYITHAEKVRDINRIYKDPEFSELVSKKLGKEVYQMLVDSLKYIANPNSEFLDITNRWFEKQRILSTAYILGLNLKVALKQPFSVFGGVREIGGWSNFFRGVKQVLFTSPMEAKRSMELLSPYMESRSKAMDREIKDATQRFDTPAFSLKGYKGAKVRDAVFIFIRMMDFVTVYPLWWGAYEKGMKDSGGDIKEAINFADTAVAASQPSSRALDLSRFQRNRNGIMRLFTMFMTFTIKYGNRQRTAYKAFREGATTFSQFMGFVVMEALIPPILMNLMFAGGWGEEPEAAGIATDWFLYQFSGLPFVRDLTYGTAAIATGKWVPDVWDSPVYTGFKIYQSFAKGMTQWVKDLDNTDKAKKAFLGFCEMASFAIGVPASQVYKRIMEGYRQYDQEDGTWFNILVPSPQKRKK